MEFPCPIKCSLNATHAWGSLAFCDTFKAKELPIKRDLVRKGRICLNCLKANNHTPLKPCRAQPCFNCKAAHHTLMCPKGPNGHVLVAGTDRDEDGDRGPDDDKDSEDNDKNESQGDNSQVFMTSYEEEDDYLDDFDPEDEDFYEVEDAPNEVEIKMDDLSQVLFNNIDKTKENEFRSNTELMPISYEEVEEVPLILEPEKAMIDKEFISDESLELELESMYKENQEEKDSMQMTNNNNNLTKANKIELNKWVLRFDSFKEKKTPVISSTVALKSKVKTPLAHSLPEVTIKNLKPNPPLKKTQSGFCHRGK